jgi:peptidoglycan/LPS O-acetylase OafA/YrhL
MLLPCLWIGALEALFRPGWPGYQNLVNDWANFTVYLSFFFFGLIAGIHRSLLERAQRLWFMMLAAGLFLFISRMAMYQLTHGQPGYSPANMAAQFLRGAAAYCLVFGVLGFAGRYMNRGAQGIVWARNVSFPLYLLHYLPVTAATYLLLNAQFSVWTRWTIAVLASWISVALFTRLSLLIPAFRWFFGIRIEVSRDYLSRTVGSP